MKPFSFARRSQVFQRDILTCGSLLRSWWVETRPTLLKDQPAAFLALLMVPLRYPLSLPASRAGTYNGHGPSPICCLDNDNSAGSAARRLPLSREKNLSIGNHFLNVFFIVVENSNETEVVVEIIFFNNVFSQFNQVAGLLRRDTDLRLGVLG